MFYPIVTSRVVAVGVPALVVLLVALLVVQPWNASLEEGLLEHNPQNHRVAESV
jgi:hypothetical protein